MDFISLPELQHGLQFVGQKYRPNGNSAAWLNLVSNKLRYLVALADPQLRNSFSAKPYDDQLKTRDSLSLGFIPAHLMALGDSIFVALHLHLEKSPYLQIRADLPPHSPSPYADWASHMHTETQFSLPLNDTMPNNWETLAAAIRPALRAAVAYIENITQSRQPLYPLNQIFYGPPGTGKTYATIAAALAIVGAEELHSHRPEQKKAFDSRLQQGQIQFITFHQSTSYEDFVEGIKPHALDNGQINYTVQPGILRRIADLAAHDWHQALHPRNFVLIIDEINRGNIAQIFGELITLLEKDKRIGQPEALELTLPYSKTPFSLPPNLYFIGTMNTADRSIEPLDSALRRRFDFHKMPPIPSLLDPNQQLWRLLCANEALAWDDPLFLQRINKLFQLSNPQGNQYTPDGLAQIWDTRNPHHPNTPPKQLQNADFKGLHLSQLLTRLNLRIAQLIGTDRLIGHSYFMQVFCWADLQQLFQRQIIPLLEEYFLGDLPRIGLVLGEAFFYPSPPVQLARFFDYDPDAMPRPAYALRDLSEMPPNEFAAAIHAILQ